MHQTAGLSDLERELAEWAATVLGSPDVGVTLLPGGNRRRAMIVESKNAEGMTSRSFLRFATAPTTVNADIYTLEREAMIYRALAGAGIPMPRLLAQHQSHAALLFECLEGDASFVRLPVAFKPRLARSLVEALAQLHSLDIATLDLGDPKEGLTQVDHVRRELAVWRSMYEETGRRDALIEFALDWLDSSVPQDSGRVCVVHGDAGPGNFMSVGGHLTGLIDWELWHVGDPVEDLAWLSMRSVLEPVPDFHGLLTLYERLSGVQVPMRRLDYHAAFVSLRVLIVRHRDDPAASDSDLGHSILSGATNRRLLVESLARQMVVQLVDPPKLTDSQSRRTPYHDFMIEHLRTNVLARSVDPVVVQKTKSIARVAKFLRDADRLGDSCAAQRSADLEALIGKCGNPEEALLVLVGSRQASPSALLNFFWRESVRETQIAAAALGGLATRNHPFL